MSSAESAYPSYEWTLEKDSSLERRTDFNSSDVWEEAAPDIPGLKQAMGEHAKLL